MKYYIAGPMTGIADFNRKAFNDASAEVIRQGCVPLNPATLPDGLEQHEYMAICIEMLKVSDGVIMLPGWESSLGAKAEHAIAVKLGKWIVIQEEESK